MTKLYKKELLRKLLHLSSLWIPLFIYFVDRNIAIAVFGALFVGNVLIEYMHYKKTPLIRKYIGFIISKISRGFENQKTTLRFSGSVFMLLATLLAVIIFPRNIAIISISVMLISDTAAALVGRAFGKIKLCDGKSLEGTLAFFVSAIITSLVLKDIVPFGLNVVLACFGATIFELFCKRLKIDDNFGITMTMGAILSIL